MERNRVEFVDSFKFNIQEAVRKMESLKLDEIEIPNASGMVLVREGAQEGRSVVSRYELDQKMYYVCEA